jgi:hypothetical protein
MRIPFRVRRPSAAREALCLSPLVEASGAHSPRLERVPLMPAGAEPFVFLARQPAAAGIECGGHWDRDSCLGLGRPFESVELRMATAK